MIRKLTQFIRKLFIYILVSHILYILYCWVFPPPVTFTQLSSLVTGHGLSRDYIPYNKMGDNAKLAVIASEDQLFPVHNGFDWKHIEKALKHNEKKPNKIRGGSTISQQVAKNVFLWQGRSYLRKGLEAYFTFWIELLYSKKRILELYLNVAETGDGIFGIEAASRHYFNKSAAQLNRREAALIIAGLPNPKVYKINPPSAYIAARSVAIQRQINNIISDPETIKLLKP